MIEQIEDVHAYLHLHPFTQVVILDDAEIKVPVVRSTKSVAAQIPKVLRTRNTVAHGVQRARHFECRDVQKAVRCVCASEGISHEVGPAKEFAASIEVAFKQIIDVEGLA